MKSGSHKQSGGKSSEVPAPPPAKGQQHGRAEGSTRLSSSYQEQLTEDRAGKVNPHEPGSDPVGAISSANSVSADPFAREKALAEPVPQVTRHI